MDKETLIPHENREKIDQLIFQLHCSCQKGMQRDVYRMKIVYQLPYTIQTSLTPDST